MSGEHRENSPAFNYHLLRNALNGFNKNLSQLDSVEYEHVYRKARKSFDLESRILASPEAEGLVITQQQLDYSVAEVAARYESLEEFHSDLQANSLDETGLRCVLPASVRDSLTMQ